MAYGFTTRFPFFSVYVYMGHGCWFAGFPLEVALMSLWSRLVVSDGLFLFLANLLA